MFRFSTQSLRSAAQKKGCSQLLINALRHEPLQMMERLQHNGRVTQHALELTESYSQDAGTHLPHAALMPQPSSGRT
jgi:hypothetical protein